MYTDLLAQFNVDGNKKIYITNLEHYISEAAANDALHSFVAREDYSTHKHFDTGLKVLLGTQGCNLFTFLNTIRKNHVLPDLYNTPQAEQTLAYHFMLFIKTLTKLDDEVYYREYQLMEDAIQLIFPLLTEANQNTVSEEEFDSEAAKEYAKHVQYPIKIAAHLDKVIEYTSEELKIIQNQDFYGMPHPLHPSNAFTTLVLNYYLRAIHRYLFYIEEFKESNRIKDIAIFIRNQLDYVVANKIPLERINGEMYEALYKTALDIDGLTVCGEF